MASSDTLKSRGDSSMMSSCCFPPCLPKLFVGGNVPVSEAEGRTFADPVAKKSDSASSANLSSVAPTPSLPSREVAVTTTTPSFQMPLEWFVGTALRLAQIASESQEPIVSATVKGYSTPSTLDVGGASLRLSVDLSTLLVAEGHIFGSQGSVALALRRSANEPWLPAIAGVPGHHADRAGMPRNGLLEVMILARPTSKGRITFLPEDVLHAWVPVGLKVELRPLRRFEDFHIDDGSGPWLRDRICITASSAEDFALESGGVDALNLNNISDLLFGSGLKAESKVSPPPMDEWDLTRAGTLHRDVEKW